MTSGLGLLRVLLAGFLREHGDLDAIVDLELVEQAGDVALDGRDGEVQRRGGVGVCLAAADGEARSRSRGLRVASRSRACSTGRP
jgi:hypothetical protein